MTTEPANLLASRRFLPLFLTQLFGALNDNLFKNALVVLALFKASEGGAPLVAIAGGLFILPYALFSATAGQLADRHDKARLIRLTKLWEVGLMALAAVGFLTNSLPVLMAVLFGLGAQSTFFSPLKYGILPDHLSEAEIVRGNALIEAGTFLGILVGTIAGGALILLEDGALITSAAGLAIAAAGAAAAFRVPAAPIAAPDLRVSWNVVRETRTLVVQAKANRPVWMAILGISWFWTVGATFLAEFPVIAKDNFGADNHVITLMLATFAFGVGAGSVLCGRLLNGEISARHVPFAAFGLSLAAVDFARVCLGATGDGAFATAGAILAAPLGLRMLGDLFLVAVCGGVFSVPLYAILQERSAAACRSRMVAANNIANAAFMVVGAGAAAGLSAQGVSAPDILLLTAGLNLVAAVYITATLRQEVARALLRGYFRLFHGAEVTGLENVALAGERRVVVVNHLSFLDGCFVAAHLPGNPVFAIDTEQAKRFGFLRHLIDLYPVDPTNPMATKGMIKAVREGRQLVIFPEGRITVTGGLMKVYDGPGTIADKADAQLLPVRIEGLQFHKFSRMQGTLPLRWFPKLSMTALPPVKPVLPDGLKGKARRQELTFMMQDTMTSAAFRPETTGRSLFAALLEAKAKYDTGAAVVADAQRNEANYAKIVLGATVLGGKLAAISAPGERVGVMLPNSLGVVVTFFGLQAYGRVPAMMNFSTGADAMIAACTAAEIKTIVTSRLFVEKGKLDKQVAAVGAHARVVYLEDLRADIGAVDKLDGKARSLVPSRLPGGNADPDSPAVVLFTSGSEGTPKGVVLSHRNILSNVAQVAAVVALNPADKFFSALPVFHSMGLTGGMLLPLFLGIRTFLYPSPLHYKLVPELVYAERSTVMFATDSFLNGYARMARPEDFESLRFIVAGAEKVKEETRQIYMKKFQKPIYEGYGATECAPVIAVNTPTHFQAGTVGRLLPGLEHRLEAVPGIEEGGRLHVKGPNVMLGYLKADAPGVLQAPEAGWYDTGDIVNVCAKGFVRILGRAKRFAKIAGEMVSLSSAEALAAATWPEAAHAVVSLPDPRKGEQLLLITTQAGAGAKDLLGVAREKGVAEIMVPRSVHVIDKLPLLGTGKTDYPAVQKLAEAWLAAQKTPANANTTSEGAVA